MAKPRLKIITPIIEKRTVTPTRRPNKELRTREHLTQSEVEKLIKATGSNRYGHRNATMILVAYRHGLRASELTDLRWDQVDFKAATVHINRVKKGTPATHPLQGDATLDDGLGRRASLKKGDRSVNESGLAAGYLTALNPRNEAGGRAISRHEPISNLGRWSRWAKATRRRHRGGGAFRSTGAWRSDSRRCRCEPGAS
jgi:integrase